MISPSCQLFSIDYMYMNVFYTRVTYRELQSLSNLDAATTGLASASFCLSNSA